MSYRHCALILALAAPACSGPTPLAAENGETAAAPVRPAPATTPARPAPKPSTAAPAGARYLGRWVGVEGMFLQVTPGPGDRVTIENQWDLDHRGSFDGTATATGLRWTRNGETITAVATDGDATGLKWLAGKKDCLTVKPGEGYCRS